MRAPLLILLAAGIVSGCSCSPSPNGKDETLQFNDAPTAQPYGAEAVVHIPEHIHIGASGGKLDISFPYDEQLDFSNTTLETSVTGGLEVVDVQQAENRDYYVRVLCRGTAPVAAELSVRIQEGKSVRYRDALDFYCYRDWTASTNHDGESWIVGQHVEVLVNPTEARDGGMPLTVHRLALLPSGGFDFDYGDAGTPQNVYSGVPLQLRTTKVSDSLLLQSGEWSAALPVRVLDDSQWKMKVVLAGTRIPENGNGLIVNVVGAPFVDGVGEAKGKDGCRMTGRELVGNSSTEADQCDANVWMTDRPWKFCMHIRDNQGCLVVELDGGSYVADAGP